jgi:hypothetical protein
MKFYVFFLSLLLVTASAIAQEVRCSKKLLDLPVFRMSDEFRICREFGQLYFFEGANKHNIETKGDKRRYIPVLEDAGKFLYVEIKEEGVPQGRAIPVKEITVISPIKKDAARNVSDGQCPEDKMIFFETKYIGVKNEKGSVTHCIESLCTNPVKFKSFCDTYTSEFCEFIGGHTRKLDPKGILHRTRQDGEASVGEQSNIEKKLLNSFLPDLFATSELRSQLLKQQSDNLEKTETIIDTMVTRLGHKLHGIKTTVGEKVVNAIMELRWEGDFDPFKDALKDRIKNTAQDGISNRMPYMYLPPVRKNCLTYFPNSYIRGYFRDGYPDNSDASSSSGSLSQ